MIFPETAVIFLAKYTSSSFLLSHIAHLIFPSVTHSSSLSHNKASSYLSLLFLHFLSFQICEVTLTQLFIQNSYFPTPVASQR
jgi:hypothetical protein